MKNYSTKKSNSPTKKSNIFTNMKKLNKKIALTNKNIDTLEKNLQYAKYQNNFDDELNIKIELRNQRKHLNTLKEKHSHLTRKITNVAAIFGLSAAMLGTSYGIHKENENFNQTLNEAYSIVQQDDNLSKSDLAYEAFKDDIETFVTLSKKDNLSKEEKEKLENTRTRIKSNPENITKFSLDILKQKIGDSLGIDDYTNITIKDKSRDTSAGKNYTENGTKTDISISYNGTTIASLEEFGSLSTGEIYKNSDTIPKEVLNVINKIVISQTDSQNIGKATKALKSSLELDSKDISFDTEKVFDENNER